MNRPFAFFTSIFGATLMISCSLLLVAHDLHASESRAQFSQAGCVPDSEFVIYVAAS